MNEKWMCQMLTPLGDKKRTRPENAEKTWEKDGRKGEEGGGSGVVAAGYRAGALYGGAAPWIRCRHSPPSAGLPGGLTASVSVCTFSLGPSCGETRGTRGKSRGGEYM